MAFRPVQPQDCLPRFLPAAGPLCLPGLCPAGVKEHYCCQPGDNRRHGSGFAEHFRGPSNLRSRALRHSTQAIPDGSRQGAWFHSLQRHSSDGRLEAADDLQLPDALGCLLLPDGFDRSERHSSLLSPVAET